MTTTTHTDRLRVGDRIAISVGGIDTEMTISALRNMPEIVESGTGRVICNACIAARSTARADHPFTKLWVRLPNQVEVVTFAPATDAEFDV